MNDSRKDLGIIQALLDRLNNERLPRAFKLKAQVERGEPLTDPDIKFLKLVFADTEQIRSFAVKHPDYQPLFAQLTWLYSDIVNKGLKNEKTPGKSP